MSYNQLETTFYRLAQLNHASAMLGWDQQVMMPPKGNDSRGRALAELSVIATEILQQDSLGDLFDAAEDNKLNLESWQQANLRQMRSLWTRAAAIPKALVEAEVMATNNCAYAWRSYRGRNNWLDFKPLLQEVFDLSREKAQALSAALATDQGYHNDYDALLDLFDPGTRQARVDALFNELKTVLPDLQHRIMEKQHGLPAPLSPSQPVARQTQLELSRAIMTVLGFDFDAGRLDETLHPFSGGVSDDSRITSRIDENNVLESIMATIHETGHSRYETGLNRDWRFKPLGHSMGMSIHESQSLFFEMQMARSEPFINAIQPMVTQHLGTDPAFNAKNLHRNYTRVQPSLIRVNADEVTYPLHVILRYEIERDIILGRTTVADIPERWDEAMLKYLTLDTRGNYQDGPTQDIHWPSGAIGYFPSYTLGAMNAAQLHHALAQAIPHAAELVGRLELEPIFNWLAAHIWEKGCLLSTDELMREATGDALQAHYFIDHLQSRYL
ncbi:MAG: carboxypeptidase M32 [Pseudomonadales bacterium]|nr:carboxypeptidase M32 [Pseudomonadales bacterium]